MILNPALSVRGERYQVLSRRNEEKLPSAKAPLPKFRSDEGAADYFETHSVADVWNQLLTPSRLTAW